MMEFPSRERERGEEREPETERVREKRRGIRREREVEKCDGKREARDGIPVARERDVIEIEKVRERERVSSLFIYIFF